MHIYSEESFILICKKIKQIYSGNSIVDLVKYSVDTDTIKMSNNGTISFLINLEYDNQTNLELLIMIQEQSDYMGIAIISDLEKIFSKYKGKVTNIDLLDFLDRVVDNVNDLRLNSTLKTENEKRQYYDLNQEKLKEIGIYSAEDYISVVKQINWMDWNYRDLEYLNYEINEESFTEEGEYFNFEIILNYNHDSTTKLKISLKNNSANIQSPDIRIAGSEIIM